MTLYDLGMEIQKIREAINQINVKGSDNAALVVYAVNRCNNIITSINAIAEEQKNISENCQNGDKLDVQFQTTDVIEEEGVSNGEPDRRTAESD